MCVVVVCWGVVGLDLEVILVCCDGVVCSFVVVGVLFVVVILL